MTLLTKTIKGCLPGSGVGYRVVVKPFVGAQDFSSMVGYCTKDTGRSHFKLLLHNVEPGVNMHFDVAVSLYHCCLDYRKFQLDGKTMTST